MSPETRRILKRDGGEHREFLPRARLPPSSRAGQDAGSSGGAASRDTRMTRRVPPPRQLGGRTALEGGRVCKSAGGFWESSAFLERTTPPFPLSPSFLEQGRGPETRPSFHRQEAVGKAKATRSRGRCREPDGVADLGDPADFLLRRRRAEPALRTAGRGRPRHHRGPAQPWGARPAPGTDARAREPAGNTAPKNTTGQRAERPEINRPNPNPSGRRAKG